MSTTLAVFDLDGTLLRTGHRITPEAARQVAALVEDGLLVALASARLDESMAVVNDAIGIPLPRVSYNGAQVRLADGTLHHQVAFTITRELADALAALTRPGPGQSAVNAYLTDGRWLAFGDAAAIDREEHDTWCVATERQGRADAGELAELECLKVLCEGSEESVAAIDAAVAGIDELNLTHSGMGLHDIWPKTSGKGSALRVLCQQLGVPLDEVVAVGDSDTDLPMLTIAGASIGVQPCSAGVREAAGQLVEGPGSAELFRRVRELAGLPPR